MRAAALRARQHAERRRRRSSGSSSWTPSCVEHERRRVAGAGDVDGPPVRGELAERDRHERLRRRALRVEQRLQALRQLVERRRRAARAPASPRAASRPWPRRRARARRRRRRSWRCARPPARARRRSRRRSRAAARRPGSAAPPRPPASPRRRPASGSPRAVRAAGPPRAAPPCGAPARARRRRDRPGAARARSVAGSGSAISPLQPSVRLSTVSRPRRNGTSSTERLPLSRTRCGVRREARRHVALEPGARHEHVAAVVRQGRQRHLEPGRQRLHRRQPRQQHEAALGPLPEARRVAAERLAGHRADLARGRRERRLLLDAGRVEQALQRRRERLRPPLRLQPLRPLERDRGLVGEARGERELRLVGGLARRRPRRRDERRRRVAPAEREVQRGALVVARERRPARARRRPAPPAGRPPRRPAARPRSRARAPAFADAPRRPRARTPRRRRAGRGPSGRWPRRCPPPSRRGTSASAPAAAPAPPAGPPR